MTTHTKTPWKYEHGFIVGGIDYLADLNYCGLSDEEREANAEFIVRACNAHDVLYAALEATPCRKSRYHICKSDEEMCDRCAALALAALPNGEEDRR